MSQLTQKTNQFNLTTKRYSESDIQSMVQDEEYFLVPINVSDKFGDNGLTGLCIVKKKTDEWYIDTFLLSCRVLGRKIENALLAFVISEAKKQGINLIVGEFISTPKNNPAKTLYKDNHFTLASSTNGSEVWSYKFEIDVTHPDFITVVRKD